MKYLIYHLIYIISIIYFSVLTLWVIITEQPGEGPGSWHKNNFSMTKYYEYMLYLIILYIAIYIVTALFKNNKTLKIKLISDKIIFYSSISIIVQFYLLYINDEIFYLDTLFECILSNIYIYLPFIVNYYFNYIYRKS